jgi:hypothetical protein
VDDAVFISASASAAWPTAATARHLGTVQTTGVPFAFGTLVLIPPQVCIERTAGGFRGSFFTFLPHYLRAE